MTDALEQRWWYVFCGQAVPVENVILFAPHDTYGVEWMVVKAIDATDAVDLFNVFAWQHKGKSKDEVWALIRRAREEAG